MPIPNNILPNGIRSLTQSQFRDLIIRGNNSGINLNDLTTLRNLSHNSRNGESSFKHFGKFVVKNVKVYKDLNPFAILDGKSNPIQLSTFDMLDGKMLCYKDAYKNIDSKTIKLVRYAIRELKYFRKNGDEKLKILKEMLGILNGIYKTETKIEMKDNCGDGCYNLLNKTISLNKKLSMVTFLHEFKHSLQHQTHKPNNEDIARGWSCSLFYNATPKLYEKSVNKGLLFFY
jgi:hypothetical protein